MARRILVCQGRRCNQDGSGIVLVRDIEEFCAGQIPVEPSGCVGLCRWGPNVAVHSEGEVRILTGLTTFNKMELALHAQFQDLKVEGAQRRIAKLKYAVRREHSAEGRRKLHEEAFQVLGEDSSKAAAKEHPQLFSQLLVMRSHERLQGETPAALRDAQWAAKLAPTCSSAQVAVAEAFVALRRFDDARVALTCALELPCNTIDRKVARKQLRRLDEKAALPGEVAAQGQAPSSTSVGNSTSRSSASSPPGPRPDSTRPKEACTPGGRRLKHASTMHFSPTEAEHSAESLAQLSNGERKDGAQGEHCAPGGRRLKHALATHFSGTEAEQSAESLAEPIGERKDGAQDEQLPVFHSDPCSPSAGRIHGFRSATKFVTEPTPKGLPRWPSEEHVYVDEEPDTCSRVHGRGSGEIIRRPLGWCRSAGYLLLGWSELGAAAAETGREAERAPANAGGGSGFGPPWPFVDLRGGVSSWPSDCCAAFPRGEDVEGVGVVPQQVIF